MLKVRVKNGKITVKNKNFEITKEKEINIGYKIGEIVLRVSDCWTKDEVYLIDACYCPQENKMKIKIKTHCDSDRFEAYFGQYESASFRGLSIKVLGWYEGYKCF
ncbi:MAG: hypothetical protein JHC31_05510 [Sulfurihydrogenibium sp.]|nr:hypothetical protein [Sulfurihydrogenibium sp.]